MRAPYQPFCLSERPSPSRWCTLQSKPICTVAAGARFLRINMHAEGRRKRGEVGKTGGVKERWWQHVAAMRRENCHECLRNQRFKCARIVAAVVAARTLVLWHSAHPARLVHFCSDCLAIAIEVVRQLHMHLLCRVAPGHPDIEKRWYPGLCARAAQV